MQEKQPRVREVFSRLSVWLHKWGNFRCYAFLLFVAMTVAYNLQIWRMGFYYDDWEGVFLQKQLFSFRQIWDYFLIDRPFSSIVHVLYNPIIGFSPIGWRILGQLLNWAAILLLIKTLLKIWPKRVFEIGWIGLLLAVYPGISRQFVIRTSMDHYTSMLLFTLSLFLMVKAVTGARRRMLLTALSIGLGIIQVLIIEYFAGLELIRLLLLFYLMRQNTPSVARAARKALHLWLPYALIFGSFLFFRFVMLPAMQTEGMVVKNQLQIVSQFLADPIGVIVKFAQVIVQDSIYAVVYIWSQTIIPSEVDLQAMATMASWFLGILVAICCAAGVEIWHRRSVKTEEKEPFPVLICIISIAALLLGGLPIWIIGRQITNGIWAGRFLFGPVMGVVPLVVIFVVWMAGRSRRRVQSIVLAAILAGSLSLQFRQANKYALNWQYQRDYYWQLKWRAPGLDEKTFILSPYTPFAFNADYEIAYAVNVLYAAGNAQNQTIYWWFDGPDDIIDFDTGQYSVEKDIDVTFRTITFQSDMQHALPVFYRPARGCLLVVDPVYQDAPGFLPEEQLLFPVAHPELVANQSTDVPVDIFGAEPEHDWCYYFQKADRARQYQQWDEIIQLWNDAGEQDLKPMFGPEYLPFLEASIQTGAWEQAVQITDLANATKGMPPFLCSTWSTIADQVSDSAEKRSSWDAIKSQYGCGNP